MIITKFLAAYENGGVYLFDEVDARKFMLKADTANGAQLVHDGYNDRTQFLSPEDFRHSLRTLKDGETVWTEVDEMTFDALRDEYGITSE